MAKMKSKQRFGKQNGRWKGGISSDYRRRIKNAKKGELVHHKSKNKKDNSRSNLVVLKGGTGEHNKKHPEKGRKKKKKK